MSPSPSSQGLAANARMNQSSSLGVQEAPTRGQVPGEAVPLDAFQSKQCLEEEEEEEASGASRCRPPHQAAGSGPNAKVRSQLIMNSHIDDDTSYVSVCQRCYFGRPPRTGGPAAMLRRPCLWSRRQACPLWKGGCI